MHNFCLDIRTETTCYILNQALTCHISGMKMKIYICTNNSTHLKYTDNLICDDQQKFIFGKIPITLFFAMQEMAKISFKM